MVGKLSDYRDCSTAGIRKLDLQLINQIQRIAPGSLTSFDHLRVHTGGGCHAYLQAPAVIALEKAIKMRGIEMTCNSAYRTIAQQCILFNHLQSRRCGIRAAATPGKSNHNTGLAIDIEDAHGWRPYLEKFGWDWIGSFDPMHFDYRGAGTKDISWISIKAFQQLHNLNNKKKIDEDGKWGIQTQLALLACSQEGFANAPLSGFDRTDSAQPKLPIISMPSLRPGDKGKFVRSLQVALCRKNIVVVQDGDFGADTKAALIRFQVEKGLVADGVVGAATWNALQA